MSKKKQSKVQEPESEVLAEALGDEPEPEKGEETPDGVQGEGGEGEEEAAEEVDRGGTLKDESDEAETQRANAAERDRAQEEADAVARAAEEAAADPEASAIAAISDAEAAAEREKALRDEITQLRAKNRALQQPRTEIQAPAPQVVPVVTPPAQDPAQVGGAGVERIDVQFDDAGKPFIDQTAVNQIVSQRVAQATAPDPQQEFNRLLDTEKASWIGVGEDAPARSAAATRMEHATEFLSEATRHHSMSTGQNPEDAIGWVDVIESSGIGGQFRQHFPEITDMYGFIQTFFAPAFPKDRIRNGRRYMDAYMVAQGQAGAPAAEVPAGSDEGEPSNVVPIPQKPRSMASKGSPAPVDTGAKSRLSALEEKASENPVGMSEEDWAEYESLSEKKGTA